jgi:hypothetical protein
LKAPGRLSRGFRLLASASPACIEPVQPSLERCRSPHARRPTTGTGPTTSRQRRGLAPRGPPLAARVGTGEPDGDAPTLIVMHRAPSGLYIELVDRSLRETLFGRDLAED